MILCLKNNRVVSKFDEPKEGEEIPVPEGGELIKSHEDLAKKSPAVLAKIAASVGADISVDVKVFLKNVFEVLEEGEIKVRVAKSKEPKEPRDTKTTRLREFIADKEEFSVEQVMEVLPGENKRSNVMTIISVLCNKERTKKDPLPFWYDKNTRTFKRSAA